MNHIHIVLADDNHLVARGVRDLLEQKPGYRVVGMARNSVEALNLVELSRPDLLITDLNMPESDVFQMIENIKSAWPTVKVIALTMYKSPLLMKKALRAGVDGFVSKDQDVSEMLNVIELVLHGPSR